MAPHLRTTSFKSSAAEYVRGSSNSSRATSGLMVKVFVLWFASSGIDKNGTWFWLELMEMFEINLKLIEKGSIIIALLIDP